MKAQAMHITRQIALTTLALIGLAKAQQEVIDLGTVLRLAGANPPELELARSQLREAQEKHAQVRQRFFPWMTAGVAYQRQEGNAQDTPGNVTDVSKQSYRAGLGIVAQLDLGDAIYQSMAARQRALAAGHDADSVGQELVARAGIAYYDLLLAQARLKVIQQSRQMAADYQTQVNGAVAAGVVGEADRYRAKAQVLRHEIAANQAHEAIQIASVRLCEILRLPNGLDLRGLESQLVPLDDQLADKALGEHVRLALEKRPELRSREALLKAAKLDTRGVVQGALIPSIALHGFTGGMAGGPGGSSGRFDDSNDLMLSLGWRIGPGGLFDHAGAERARAAEETQRILLDKARLQVTREVLEAVARLRALDGRMAMVRDLLDTSEKAYRFSVERGVSGVGGVLETLRAEEDLSLARMAWLDLVHDHNQARIRLRRACAE